MAFPREILSRRQKACLGLSIILLIFGVLQISLGIYSSFQTKARKCTGAKGFIIGLYVILAGISGAIGYFPRKARSHCKQIPVYGRKHNGSRSAVMVFVILCGLVAVLVVIDSNAFHCAVNAQIHAHGENEHLFAILGLLEVTLMHAGHLLCALCVGLAGPDLFFKGPSSEPSWDSSTKLDKSSNQSLKSKSLKQALHLPEARTHVQEVPGTGEKVTVVSLPQTEGIVYAVPEEQYVIRRGEATYMAPSGNTKLAAFFPTYTRIQAE